MSTILFQTAIVKFFHPTVQRLPTVWNGAPLIMSCLPLILLGSVPLTHQSEVPYPKCTVISRERRPDSSILNCTSVIVTQPAKEPTSVPAYPRFDKYDNRMSSRSQIYLTSGDTKSEMADIQATRVRSAPVPLKFEFRSSRGHETPVPETEKGRGKKRASNPESYINSEYTSEDLCDDDHVAPFRSSHTPKAPPSSLAGPSGSASNPRHASRDLSLLQQSHVHVPEDGPGTQSPQLSRVSSAVSSSSIRPTEVTEGVHNPKVANPSCPSPHLPKRVSFSSVADRGVSATYRSSQDEPSTQIRVPWGGLALFGKSYLIARPPASLHISLPAVRGQAAGRSILKRTTSCSDNFTLPNSDDFNPTGVPIHDKIQIESLQRSSKRSVECGSASSILNNRNNSGFFEEIVLSQGPSANADTASTNTASARSTLSSDERAVRHWSMVGSNWIRRSGLFTQAVDV